MYRVYAKSAKTANFGGKRSNKAITVRKGWNRIGYLSTINLPIAQAMSDYTVLGSEGDVLKSQDGFSMLSRNSSGELTWKGTLQYLEVGHGYMLKRNAASTESFIYPLYYDNNRYSGSAALAPEYRNHTATTMNIVAQISDAEVCDGDSLVTYDGARRCGAAAITEDGLFFLNIGGDEKTSGQNLFFCIERDGELVAATQSPLSYQADAVLGTPEEPTQISFVKSDRYADGYWYTLDGIRLQKKPRRTGLYIHNDKIEILK